MFEVEEKRVLITGAGGGIGSILGNAFEDRKAIVFHIDNKDNFLHWNKYHSSNYINDIRIIKADITKFYDREIILKMVDKVDILINCAGVTNVSWTETLSVNLTGTYEITKAIIDNMIENNIHGSIINITSINSIFAFPDNPQYVASKGGLRMLTKALALDYGKHGIRVNNLCPGYIHTNMTKHSYTNNYEKIKERTILGRWGKPDDLVGAAIFLASDASSYVTGIDLIVDGGWSAKGL